MKTSFRNISYACLLLFCMVFMQTTASASSKKDTTNFAGLTFVTVQSIPRATVGGNIPAGKIVQQLTPTAPSNTNGNLNLWTIFLAGFLGGLAAILLPCIFPMLPLTVSFFFKRQVDRRKGILDTMVYGLSIILIYVCLGMVITIAFGANALNALSTNGIFNFIFFLLLVSFAASFFGAFEITLANKWLNKADENSGRKGFAGIFFMAATLALVSFSCTGPIIGTLLVQAATSGARLGPAIGMLGFSIALALPFVLFALFPSWLNGLPKSGGWLNSVKVCLGFLELALSLKFLSNVDLTYHWHFFDREVFLALWIVIAILAGLYLLGKLYFTYDSAPMPLTAPRLLMSIVVLSFAVYMIPGLWGAPLKSIAAFLPPQATQDFDLYTPLLAQEANPTQSKTDIPSAIQAPRKYAKLFGRPLDLDPFFDYKEGLAYAQKVNKPALIDFTGHACVNCRKMEATVWPDRNVLPVMRNDYVLIQLFVDDKTLLAADEQQYTSKLGGSRITTIGELNSDIQATQFNTNSQPFYVLLNPVSQLPLVTPQGALYDPADFYNYLESGLKAFRQ